MNKNWISRWIAGVWMATLFVGLATSNGSGAAAWLPQGQSLGGGPTLILLAQQVPGGSSVKILPPADLLRAAPQSATIHVNYVGVWDPAAKAAFEYARQIWEMQITSPVAIQVVAKWEDLSGYGSNVLGGAKAHDYWRDFTNAPVSGTWYSMALANKLAGTDLNDHDGVDTNGDGLDADPEIEASFNSAFSGWYFGTDGNPAHTQYDFVSVVLHELCHGLGFSGSMTVSGSAGSWGYSSGYPFIYDTFGINDQGQSLIDTNIFANGSAALGDQLTGGKLYFNGPHAKAANAGAQPILYAPATWEQGSSFSHLDENTYSSASANALMTPAIANGEVVHDPGAIARGILEDIGWTLAQAPVTTSYIYLPFTVRSYSSVRPGIYGHVTLNGSNASGVPLDLRFYDGASWTGVMTTTTDSLGNYLFSNVTSLTGGQKYYVRYMNTGNTAGRLFSWGTRVVTAYTSGASLAIGDFDLADVALVTPTMTATVSLPVTFQWTPRPGMLSDSYELNLYDLDTSDPWWWTDPALGYVGSYTLSALPVDPVTGTPFVAGVPYWWEVWVYGPDGGYGISQAAREVTFSQAANQPSIPAKPGIRPTREDRLIR